MPNLRPQRLAIDTTGSVLVEASLALPIIIMLSIGAIAFGWQVWAVTTLNIVTARAARCAAINTGTCGTVSAVQNYAVAESQNAGMPFTAANFPTANISLSTRCTGATWSSSYSVSQNCSRVTGTYVFNFNIPFFRSNSSSMNFSAEYPTVN